MNDIEIVNPVPADEMRDWAANTVRQFLHQPSPREIQRMGSFWGGRLEPERTWGARDDGQWVATLATDSRSFTVPGRDGGTNDLTVDALTAVTTSPTHRRRGLLSAMIGASLAAAKDRGDALSVLIAAEWPIYGRFGYGPAIRFANYEYAPRLPRAGVSPAPAGAVRHVEPAELLQSGPDAFERTRRARAGQIDRPPFWWHRFLAPDDDKKDDGYFNLAVHERDGVVDGFLAWRPEGDFELDGSLATVSVLELNAADDIAYRNLWSYIASLDVVEKVGLNHRPVDEPARWLMDDGRAVKQTYAGDFVWVRLLDVPAALTARGYAAAGRLVIDVVDESAGAYARGRWALDAGPDGASCEPTSAAADVRLPATVLASAYLGGYRLRPIAVSGAVEELTPGALERLDVMFATSLEPWCATGF